LTSNIALAPQINLDHALVLRDLVDRAFRQHRAFVQASDLDAELAHESHVVLDHDYGAVAIDLLEELGGLPRLGIGHARNRLVDEKKLGLLRQQHADLEPLFLTVRQRAGDAVAHRRQPDGVENAVDAASLFFALPPEQSLARALVALQREADIVLHRVHVEHSRLLELAADAEQRDLGLVKAREIVGAIEVDLARVRSGLAGDHIHHSGFAGTIGTDDGAHL